MLNRTELECTRQWRGGPLATSKVVLLLALMASTLEKINRTRHVAVLTQANEFNTKAPYRLISSGFYAKRLGMIS